ncbi:hypothetical protein FZ046_07810 [Mycolicibacterium grossiae]|nr:hypothetical protein FZ046_07810 [Mycolicibacterium grossiae]
MTATTTPLTTPPFTTPPLTTPPFTTPPLTTPPLTTPPSAPTSSVSNRRVQDPPPCSIAFSTNTVETMSTAGIASRRRHCRSRSLTKACALRTAPPPSRSTAARRR